VYSNGWSAIVLFERKVGRAGMGVLQKPGAVRLLGSEQVDRFIHPGPGGSPAVLSARTRRDDRECRPGELIVSDGDPFPGRRLFAGDFLSRAGAVKSGCFYG
jgi:hypothetical protein